MNRNFECASLPRQAESGLKNDRLKRAGPAIQHIDEPASPGWAVLSMSRAYENQPV
jgi:hypothetical protein